MPHMKTYALLFSIFLMGFMSDLQAQDPAVISWSVLADVEYKEQYDEALQAYWLVPEFGSQPRRFEGKEVVLMGYFIPFNLDSEFYVLSRFPYSNCFFCGGAGPETVLELQFKKPPCDLTMDKKYFFRGTLALNNDDFDHCNYILKNAKVITEDEVWQIKKQ